MLNPTTPSPPALTAVTGADAEIAPVDNIGNGLADGASSYVVDLWIDLSGQASSSEPTLRLPSFTGLSRQQFRALNCLQANRLRSTVLPSAWELAQLRPQRLRTAS